MRLLARREHSNLELTRKLDKRGFDLVEIGRVLRALSDEGLLSDRRFAEAFARAAISRGLGPVRIRRELAERGIGDTEAEVALTGCDPDWLAQAERVRRKRFGCALPTELRERARQTRFLAYRGFAQDQIGRVLRGVDE